MVSKAQLLQVLPPFTNSSLLIEHDQDVSGIIREVVNAHKCFASDYDLIYDFFMRPTLYQTCKALFDFCKGNIRYVIESEDAQTTKSPSALLSMGFGDCKHYAGFIAGVLSAIVRNTGEKIKWVYRFTGYDYFSSEPGHVFVVVNDGGTEIWIDPVLKTFDERLKPVIIVDKKLNDMALLRVSGVEELEFTETMADDLDIIPDLDYSTDDQDAGLSPELITAIHLLLYYDVLDLEGNIDDFKLLALQNELSDDEFRKLVNARQFLNSATVSGLFSSIFRGIKKVTLAAPRAAYLSVVALNVFGTATKLKQATTTQDGINKVRDVWYKLGGDWAKLRDAISNGSKRKRILGIGNPALPAWVVTASAIIAAMTPIITSILKQQQDQGLLGNDFDPSLLNPDPYSGLDGSGKTPLQDFIREYGAWIAVGGLGLYLYFNSRKRRS